MSDTQKENSQTSKEKLLALLPVESVSEFKRSLVELKVELLKEVILQVLGKSYANPEELKHFHYDDSHSDYPKSEYLSHDDFGILGTVTYLLTESKIGFTFKPNENYEKID